MSPSKISLKFLKGEGELRNLELNEKFLTDLLELPPFIRLTRAVCNKISAKVGKCLKYCIDFKMLLKFYNYSRSKIGKWEIGCLE